MNPETGRQNPETVAQADRQKTEEGEQMTEKMEQRTQLCKVKVRFKLESSLRYLYHLLKPLEVDRKLDIEEQMVVQLIAGFSKRL